MPAISKIRLCNVIYENGGKRYNDQLFQFDGQNTAILLENGGGKTVFIQAVLQGIIPHINMSDRKIKDTLYLEAGPAHIAIEWILNEQPRRYALTAVTLYNENGTLNSLKYTYEYGASDSYGIEELPFKQDVGHGNYRPASRGEISEYYQRMAKTNPYSKVFNSIVDYGKHLEEAFKIIPSEWRKVAVINSGEGNVDEYFNRCKTTEQLLNNLLIPVVEEAIEGETSVQFANTFEKQRDHFKKNRILHDKILQSQGAKVEIDNYINTYKMFYQVKKNYQKIKDFANSHVIYINEAIKGLDVSKEQIDKRRRELELEKQLKKRQDITYNLLRIESRMEAEDQNLEAIAKKEEALVIQHVKYGQRRQNIQLSKVEKNIQQLQSELKQLELELLIEDKKLPIEDLKIQLLENSSNIKGCLSYELELIHMEEEKLVAQMTSLLEKKKDGVERLELTKVKERQSKDFIIKTEAAIELKREMMDRIYDELFDDHIGVDVSEQYIIWQEELLVIQGNLNKAERRLIENEENRLAQTKAIEDIESELLQKLGEHKKINEKIKIIEEKSTHLFAELDREGFKISAKDIIYTKEESILSLLEDKILYYKGKKDDLLQEELRIMSELLKKDVIHPSIINVYNRLKEKMSYLVTGLDYLDQLAVSMSVTKESLLSKFPYFPMTLITNRGEKAAVLLAAEQLSTELSVPLYIYTIEEITKICQESEKNYDENLESDLSIDQVIIPKFWEESLNKTYMFNYNEALEKELQEVRLNRAQQEKSWLNIATLQERIVVFFEEYSYASYNQLIVSEHEIAGKITQLDLKLIDHQKVLGKLKEAQQEFIADKVQFLAHIESLQKQIDQGEKHGELYNEYLLLRDREETARIKASDFIYKRGDEEFEIKQYETEIAELQNQIKEFLYEARKITESDLYQEVNEAKPICNNTDLVTLKKQRESLILRIQGISATREAINIRLKEQTKLLSHYEDQKHRLLKEASFKLETIELFYEHEEDDLFDKIVRIKQEQKVIEQEMKKSEKSKWSLDTEKNLLVNNLTLSGTERFVFDCDLEHIPTRIKMLEGTIRDIEKHIRLDEAKLAKKIDLYQEAKTALLVKDGGYNFIREDGKGLTPKEIMNLEEDVPLMLHQLFKQLADVKTQLDTRRLEVVATKEKVLQYCQQNIDDYRLKDAIEKGLMDKEDYEELLIYQERLTDVIHKTIQLATDDKRESDQELMTFLSHLYTYVVTVVEELNALQKKTSIDDDSGMKQIFVFDIPEIDEVIAREGLRVYVDQMIETVEHDTSGDEESLRSIVEERFNVKNLIPIVLQGVAIKVKCRKVTNDLKINKAPMSWEFSNKWSGGEKWSKNMTLFLGILNYLAEKRQHLSMNQKNNRTVILDNPFGKASSKHVLDPVFYIAEKLGFQIIALTAHAEGQFIRDYFPVVYSLRLRDTTQSDKKLVTTERQLNYTYLKEKAPASITRLQEVEQIDLFHV